MRLHSDLEIVTRSSEHNRNRQSKFAACSLPDSQDTVDLYRKGSGPAACQNSTFLAGAPPIEIYRFVGFTLFCLRSTGLTWEDALRRVLVCRP